MTYADVVEKYDTAFFEEQALVLVLTKPASSSYSYRVSKATYFPDQSIQILTECIIPEGYAEDLVLTHIFIEIDQKYIGRGEVAVTFETRPTWLEGAQQMEFQTQYYKLNSLPPYECLHYGFPQQRGCTALL